MSHWATRILWPVLLWGLACTPATGKEYWTFETAYYAYDSGEFLLAADIYKRLAKKGDPRAQHELGFLHMVGQGVPQDFALAVQWFQKAARQGHAPALEYLGGMHLSGQGVIQSNVEAHKFFTLASLLAPSDKQKRVALSRRDGVALNLTASQLELAQRSVCLWWNAHGAALRQEPPPFPKTLPDCTVR